MDAMGFVHSWIFVTSGIQERICQGKMICRMGAWLLVKLQEPLPLKFPKDPLSPKMEHLTFRGVYEVGPYEI